MKNSFRQKEIFNSESYEYAASGTKSCNEISLKILEEWKNKIHDYQKVYLDNNQNKLEQISLFNDFETKNLNGFEPLKLTPLPLNFWRWSKSYHKGAAIYLVMERFGEKKKNIILYIGETISASKRWKGEHDCKKYLENYVLSHQKVNLSPNLSIRFWSDVPQFTKERRKLEQELIQKWLPPFNKETRNRWQTPFTA